MKVTECLITVLIDGNIMIKIKISFLFAFLGLVLVKSAIVLQASEMSYTNNNNKNNNNNNNNNNRICSGISSRWLFIHCFQIELEFRSVDLIVSPC